MQDDLSFGRWLQRRRKRLGLTQAALGREVGVAAETIRKIEADVRRPSSDVAERLATCLAVDAAERRHFVRFARGALVDAAPATGAAPEEAVPGRRLTDPPTNLPAAMTPLIGREHEVADVCAIVERAGVRLVTLTGPGGIGKTRVALQAAAELRRRFRDGVYWVSLAAIREPALVLTTLAAVVGVSGPGAEPAVSLLQRALAAKRVLLVLDNMEQVLDAAPALAQLLLGAPQVKLLVISRVPLHLYGEQQLPVPPLTLPAPDAGGEPASVAESAAVTLFVARAQAVVPGFELEPGNAMAVAEICRRLDGIPLAIELAAARCALLPPAALVDRLSNRLALLTGGPRDAPLRQQTLRNTLDWSYTLLAPEAQQLLRRLAVFAGSASLAAIAAVCMAGEEELIVVDGIQALLEQSLLVRIADGAAEPRYGMLETVREYALEQLRACSDWDAMCCRHADYYVALAEAAEGGLKGPRQQAVQRQLEQEHANLRAVFSWALETGALEPAARLSWALWVFWWVGSHFAEARRLTDALVRRADLLPAASRARLLTAASTVACAQGDASRARQCVQKALELYRGGDDLVGQGLAQVALGFAAAIDGDHRTSVVCFTESVALYSTVADAWGVVLSRLQLSYAWLRLGDQERGLRELEIGLSQAYAIGDTLHIGEAVQRLGDVGVLQRRFGDAQRYYREALTRSRELGYGSQSAGILHQIGVLALVERDGAAAVGALAESVALIRRIGDVNGVSLLGSLPYLALALLQREEPVRAAAAVEESLRLVTCLDAPRLQAACLLGAAALSLQRDHAADATRLLAAAAASCPSPAALDEVLAERFVADARARLDPVTFERCWSAGSALPIAAALAAAALSVDEPHAQSRA